MITMVEFQVTPTSIQEKLSNSDAMEKFQNSRLQMSIKSLGAFKMSSNDFTSFPKEHKSYECIKCTEKFNDKTLYQIHLCKHEVNSDDLHHCDICGKSFAVPARLIRHYRTHTGEKPYQCEYCKKSFSVKENLSVHRRIHTKERPYKCDVCKSAFEHSGKLHRHMRIHTGERPHKCSLCNKTFIQSGQLVIHMRTHTGEKPYICKSCGKGFTCSKQLKVHTRTHTGEKPYKCDICEKSFGYNHVLKLHQVSHYGEKFYKCTLCQETFNSKRYMELHIKMHAESTHDLNHSPNLTTTAFEKTNSNQIYAYDDARMTRKSRISMIENKTEKKFQKDNKKPENDKMQQLSEYSSVLLYSNLIEQNNPIDQRIATLSDSQSYLSSKSNPLISKQSNFISTQIMHTQEAEMQNQVSTHFITTFNPVNSCIFELKNGECFSEESSSKYRLSSDKTKESLESHLSLIKRLEPEINTESSCHGSFGGAYSNSVNLNSNTSSSSCMMPKVKDDLCLPPRKRCKKILELMEIEKSNLRVTKRLNSVIKFAKLNSNLVDK